MLSKGTKRFSSHFADQHQQQTDKNGHASSISSINDDSTFEEVPATANPATSSSRAWIKDRVTGSLNKLATSRSANSSVDAVHHTSGDSINSLATENEMQSSATMSKSNSESNLKTASSFTNVYAFILSFKCFLDSFLCFEIYKNFLGWQKLSNQTFFEMNN